jgi:Ca2+-binding EF-hand superfamily protein
MFGMNTLANEVRRHLGSLMNDSMDFGRLVNAKRVKQFDTDGNSRIDASEVLQVLRNNGVTFSKLDDDDNGKISYGELRSELVAIARRNNARVEGSSAAAKPKAPLTKAQAIAAAVDFADINNSGGLSDAEIIKALAKKGKTMDQVDGKDNVLTNLEFATALGFYKPQAQR